MDSYHFSSFFLCMITGFLVLIPPYFSTTLASAAAATPQHASEPGAIETGGKNYSKVCDAARFEALGLRKDDFAYCDSSLPYPARVKDLVGRMTLVEKILQLGDRAQGVGRIGLPKYGWWSEALHGIAVTGHATYFGDVVPAATSFPNVILAAASFNESLWKKIGQAVSTEGRAMYNLGHTGLNFWSPNVNVVRDPRWGRVLETPGEDPFVVGRYAVNFVRGMQDVEGTENVQDLDSRPLKVSTCCKHYAAYDLDNWFGVSRLHFDARVTEQDMVETFVRPFEMCVKEGDASSIMCSYNRVNGVPACADAKLLSQTLRNDWQLHGYIVSDCDSVEVMHERLKWLGDTAEDAVGQAMKAGNYCIVGLDLDCGLGNLNYYENYTLSAVAQGKVRESDIDNALKNLYMVLMRAGFFDNIEAYENLGLNDICTKEHIHLAADAARQAIVLLKNNLTLPLDPKKYKDVVLVGPHAKATKAMIGNYEGIPCRYVSPLDAIAKDVRVDYHEGCDVHCRSSRSIRPAVEAAKKAEATIIVAGLGLEVEREELDRNDLLLPGFQTELINRVAEASAGPVVLVIMAGGCVDVSFAQNNPKIGAILWAGYPGQEGGQAIADVIFGRHNPGGRLPLTWYKNEYVDALPMTSMQLRPNDQLGYPGRTYKFFNGTSLYPFGHGMSYTQFSYSRKNDSGIFLPIKVDNHHLCKLPSDKANATVDSHCPSISVDALGCKEEMSFEVDVTNVGKVDGDDVVLVYSKPPKGVADAPLKQLVAYQRVYVESGKTSSVKFSLNACKALNLVEKTAYVVLHSGEHAIVVGDGDSAVSFPVEIELQL
ncbi:unnamed protein product [Musa acuminata var. zebrina]